MKVAIITIHNVSNYGAVLQAYALKETVGEKHEVNILDFDNRHVSKSLDVLRLGISFHSILGLGKDIMRLIPRIRVINKFKSFIRHKMDLVDFNQKNISSFDALISGSDQIWNPNCVSSNKSFVEEYFLNFALPDQIKISYASSCGSYSFSQEENFKLKGYLSAYSSLAVRELETSSNLSNLLEKKVEHVLDPTLLLTKVDWLNKIGDNKFRTGDYILIYVIKKTNVLKDTIRFIKDKLKMKIILINQGLFFSADIDEHIRDAGPEDFISLFNNAKFVITDSFHGTTFSIIFNKPFISTSPGANVNRISSLLNKLNLDSRLVIDSGDVQKISQYLDFSDANELLKTEITHCKKYLSDALK